MIDHEAVQLAFRTRLLTLQVCTTGLTDLESTETGYARASGSFVDDGFAVGMEVTPTGFPETDTGVITEVSVGALTIDGGRTVYASDTGRALTVGLPEGAAWENLHYERPGGRPYIEEAYVPGTPVLRSFPASGGLVEEIGLYVVRWYSRTNTDILALTRPANKILELFKPGTAMSLADGYSVRVLEQGPYRGQVRTDEPGWAVLTTTIPWRLFHIN